MHDLSASSRAAVERLRAHQPAELGDYGSVRQAAVLVALFEPPGTSGLRVLLTTRARHLRKALPGGKVDPTDLDPTFTARREAYEEVGLPLGELPHLHYLTRLPPFLSKYRLIVHPVVYLISDTALIQALTPSPDEVGTIFDFPLRSCLTAQLADEDERAGYRLSELGGPDWPYEHDFHNSSDGMWLEESAYRMHRFRTSHTPLKGLTSDILIAVAGIVYAESPAYERFAPNQIPFLDAIAKVVDESKRIPSEALPKRILRRTGSADTDLAMASGPQTPVNEPQIAPA